MDADGGCDSAVTNNKSEISMEMFREYIPILTEKGFSLKVKGMAYAICAWSCLIYGFSMDIHSKYAV